MSGYEQYLTDETLAERLRLAANRSAQFTPLERAGLMREAARRLYPEPTTCGHTLPTIWRGSIGTQMSCDLESDHDGPHRSIEPGQVDVTWDA